MLKPSRVAISVCLVGTALGVCARDATYKDDQIFAAKPDAAREFKALVLIPDKPQALVIAFPGGTGSLALNGSTAMYTTNWLGQYGLLTRYRNGFFKRDVALIAMDAPNGKDMTAQDRVSAVDGAKAMLDLVRKQARLPSSLPVWAVGTSTGTISAAALAIQFPGTINGIVLGSAVTRPTAAFKDWKDQNAQGVASMAVGKFDRPVLVLGAKDDKCPFSSPMDAEMLASKFVKSPRREVKVMSGGNPNGDACAEASSSPHDFNTLEDETVDAIVTFMKPRQ